MAVMRPSRLVSTAPALLAVAVAGILLVSWQAVQHGAVPAELKATAQDADDAQARLEPVKRISIFDQWTAPNKPAQEDFETENPSYAYVKPYVTTGRKYDVHTNILLTAQCTSKCQPRPGYNPSVDVVASCMKFCAKLSDANDPVAVTPQPKTRGWWRRKADSIVPGGRYVHYVANPFGGGAPAMNGQWTPDPYHTRPLGSGEGNAWISTVEGRAGVDPKSSYIRAPSQPPLSPPPMAIVPPAPDDLDQEGPPLLMNDFKAQTVTLKGHQQKAQSLLMTELVTTNADGTHGLEAINYGTHTALHDLDDYFDTLPTKDCNKPTCSYIDVREAKTKTLVKKGHKFTTKDIEKYEKSVLGYHRRHEHAMTAAEIKKLAAESAKLVSKSVDGYAKLERNANTKGAKVSSDAPFRSQRHSAAYERATKAKGFAGYYENVFADSQHKETNPPEERDGLDGDDRRAAMRRRGSARLEQGDKLEAAKALLARDTYEAKTHLAKEERRFKMLVGARLEEEQAAVALAAHKINDLKAKNRKLESEDSSLAAQARRERQEKAQARQRLLQEADMKKSASRAAAAEAASRASVATSAVAASAAASAAISTAKHHTRLASKGESGGVVLNAKGIQRSEGELKQQVKALEAFEHKAAAEHRKVYKDKDTARMQQLWNAAEDDAVEPPSADVPQHWKASRVNKAISNWAVRADAMPAGTDY